MKRKRYTEPQILKVLKESEAGRKTTDIIREYGISEKTFYTWKRKYGGLEASDIKRLKTLEAENRRLKQIVADLTLDNSALKDALGKKWYPRPPNARSVTTSKRRTSSANAGSASSSIWAARATSTKAGGTTRPLEIG